MTSRRLHKQLILGSVVLVVAMVAVVGPWALRKLSNIGALGSPVGVATMRAMREMGAEQEYLQHVQSGSPFAAAAEGARLARHGLLRLEAGMLEERARILLSVYAVDTMVCGGGGGSPGMLDRALLLGDSTLLARFGRVAATAMISEIRERPPAYEPAAGEVREFVRAASAALPPAEAVRFDDIVDRIGAGDSVGALDQCFLERELLEHALEAGGRALQTHAWMVAQGPD